MISLYICLFLSICIPTSVGYTLSFFLFPQGEIPFASKIAISYGLGIGILSYWMLIVGILKLPLDTLTITTPLLGLCILILLFLKPKNNLCVRSKQIIQKEMTGFSWQRLTLKTLEAFFLMYIIFQVFFVFWQALNLPIYSWDAIATVAYKAKILYFENKLVDLNLLPHGPYPLLVSFLETWVAINLGGWSDQWIKIIFPMTLLSFLVLQYQFLKYYTSRIWSLLGCVLILSASLFTFHATISYTDFILMYFNCLTIMFLIYWSEKKNLSLLLTASLLSGFTTFTKYEGTAYLTIHLLILTLLLIWDKTTGLKDKIKDFLLFAVPSGLICSFFHVYKIIIGATKETSELTQKVNIDISMQKLTLIPEILEKFFHHLFLSGNWSILWISFFTSIVLFISRKTLAIKTLILSIGLFFLLYFSVGLLTTNYVWIGGEFHAAVLPRLILHYLPLAVWTIILLNYPKLTTLRKEN